MAGETMEDRHRLIQGSTDRCAAADPARLLDIAATRQFVGAPLAVALLEDAADRAVSSGRPLEDTLIVGPESCGKQLVARAVARDADQRAVEVDAAWIRNARHMARVLRTMDDRDALLLRRVDQLRPPSLRVLASMMGMRSLAREADRGPSLADCTVIATAESVTRRMGFLCRLFSLQVELPAPSTDARIAAAFRAAQALGMPGTPALRAEVSAWISQVGPESPAGDPERCARILASRR